MRKHFLWIVFVVLIASSVVEAGLFRKDPDPDPRPNIFRRVGQSLTGIFKKKDKVEVSSSDVRTLSTYPDEEWVSASALDQVPQVELPPPAAATQTQLEKEPLVSNETQAGAQEEEETVESYLQKIKGLILKRAALPAEAKGTGIKETVKVYFVLDPAGGLKKVYIPEENRSNLGYINEAAMATVHEASLGFPPLPKQLASSPERVFNIEITYEDSPE